MKQPWISSAAIVSLLLTLIAIVHSFNLENRLPIYKFDDDSTSYFGYSVALHRERSNNVTWWVILFSVSEKLQVSVWGPWKERDNQMPDNNNLYCVRKARQMAPEFLIKILLITAQIRCFSCPFIPWAIIVDRIEHREFSEWTSNNNIIASALPVSPKKSGFLRRLTLSDSVLAHAHSQFFTLFFFVDSIENVCGVWKDVRKKNYLLHSCVSSPPCVFNEEDKQSERTALGESEAGVSAPIVVLHFFLPSLCPWFIISFTFIPSSSCVDGEFDKKKIEKERMELA